MRTGFWRGNLKERGDLEDQGVDGRLILRWIFRRWYSGYGLVRCSSGGGIGGMDWIDLTQDKER